MASKVFDDIINKVRHFKRNAGQIAIDECAEHVSDIIDLVTDDQLFERGEDSEGNSLSPGYSKFTIQVKQATEAITGESHPTDRVTLRDTGRFHRSTYLEFRGDKMEVKNRDSKLMTLQAKYGRNASILGVNDESLDGVIRLIQPGVQDKFLK